MLLTAKTKTWYIFKFANISLYSATRSTCIMQKAYSLLITLAPASDWWNVRLDRLSFFLKPVNGINHILTLVSLLWKAMLSKKTIWNRNALPLSLFCCAQTTSTSHCPFIHFHQRLSCTLIPPGAEPRVAGAGDDHRNSLRVKAGVKPRNRLPVRVSLPSFYPINPKVDLLQVGNIGGFWERASSRESNPQSSDIHWTTMSAQPALNIIFI